MFRVLTCLTAEHDWALVALAAIVCFVASLSAVSLFHRALASKQGTRAIWVVIAGATTGYGIWATHFIAMLAYEPGVPTTYGLGLTALSLGTAMVLTSGGFGFAVNSRLHWGASVGGGIIGGGIASMHYLGMWALEVPGSKSWSFDLVLVSIGLGILLGIVALSVAVRYPNKGGTFAAAALLTLAITAHHFTAMGAVEIAPDPAQAPDAWSLAPTTLALAIAGVALTVLGMSLVAAIADRRHSARTNKFNEIIGQLSLTKQELERSQQQLTEQNLRLDAAISNMSQGLCMFDRDKRLVVCNSHYATMYGLSIDQVKPGATLRSILECRVAAGHSPDDGEHYIQERMAEVDGEDPYRTVNKLRDGRYIAVVHQPLSIGGWVALHQDITEQKTAEEKIAHIAHHDSLTGLANRSAVAQKIEEAAARQRRWGDPFSVLLLDLDRFKHVNDSLGHPAGDALLREVAVRLRGCLRETDVLGRLGGDEFIIIQAAKANLCEGASVLANRIIEIIAKPFNIGGDEINVSTSIGIALAPEHATDPENLIKMADLALYSAKSAGRGGHRFFNTGMTEAAGARREVETELRHAIQNGELELHYQPIVDAKTRKICSAEALIRWRHPTKGMIPPDQFIPLAEDTGLISQIGEWVLRTACTEAATWPDHIKVAVNLSPVQFRKANLGDVVMYALADSGLRPERLELEITETALIQSAAECLPVLTQFKKIGITIALDDFGTGHSSLSQLTMFPFDKIKIDKSFTQNMTKRAACAAIISATLTLANSLDIATTAEGVETTNQYHLLRLAGVTSLQGYLFKRPGPAAEIDFDKTYGTLKMDDAA